MVRYLKRKARLSQYDMRRGMTKNFAFKSLLSTYMIQKLFIYSTYSNLIFIIRYEGQNKYASFK